MIQNRASSTARRDSRQKVRESLGGAGSGLTDGLLPTSTAESDGGGGGGAPSTTAAAGNNDAAPLSSSPPAQQPQQPQPYYTAGAAFLSRNSFRHGALRQSIRMGGGGGGGGGAAAAAEAALAAHDEEEAAALASADAHNATASPRAAPHPAPLTLRTDLLALKEIVFGSWLNLLLVCVPLGILAEPVLGWNATATFTLNFFALVPLALILGDITEDLAVRFGDTIGGLINATFGNVVEIILSVAALQQGLYQVVAMSLLGSILSNLLLVLGCCFICGGIYYKQQEFNPVANQASSSLLFLSCIGVVLPTAAAHLAPTGGKRMSPADVLDISRGAAVVLLGIYVAYLAFQLHTHAHLFGSGDDDGEPVLTLPGAFLALAAVTGCVAACSEFLTGSIEQFSAGTGLSQAFVGMIVLPIAGNAAEHVTAIVVAMKNKMDLSLGVAVGSSIQIALFAVPFVVLVGWATGHAFSLDFDLFSVLALVVSVLHANLVTAGATSHWLLGVELVSTYLLISVAFLYR